MTIAAIEITRTAEEIASELSALNELLSQLPQQTLRPDETRDCLHAQVHVLQDNLSKQDVLDEYEDMEDDPIMFIFESAYDAWRWMAGDDELTPSKAWPHLSERAADPLAA